MSNRTIKKMLRDVLEREKADVIRKMYELAKNGNIMAAEWIIKHSDDEDDEAE